MLPVGKVGMLAADKPEEWVADCRVMEQVAAAAGHPTDWAAAEPQGPCYWWVVVEPVPFLVAGMLLVAGKVLEQVAVAAAVESWHSVPDPSASGEPCLVNQHCSQKDSYSLQVAEAAAAASSWVDAIS
jgi:hypothetical protein